MADTHETIADIAAEKRRIAKEIRDYASNGDYWDKKRANETAEDLEEEADRLEAAHKRELSKNVSKNGADFGQLGDAAKLRERRLLMSCARWILCHDIYGHTAKELLAECKEVLNDDGQFLFKEDEQ